jgi:hypothetical protein
MKNRPWLFGNTTIRNPLRMHEALRALVESPEACPKKGRDHEIAFARFLQKNGIVDILRESADASDLGRKWRSGLVKMGFLFPESSDTPFGVTDAGKRLASAEPLAIAAQQECFLRALAGCVLPSTIETDYTFKKFAPFRYIIAVALELKRRTGSSVIYFYEMAGVLQFTNASTPVSKLCDTLLKIRERRKKEKKKRKFDSLFIKMAAKKNGYVEGTPSDYADTNFRYLKATGIFCTDGKGIAVVEHKEELARLLSKPWSIPKDDNTYIGMLTKGCSLPTDDSSEARKVFASLKRKLSEKGIPFADDLTPTSSVALIRQACFKADALLTCSLEEQYAARQRTEWEEIAAYMRLLCTGKKRLEMNTPCDDDKIALAIPSDEKPAYFEWVLWRAFLALDNLINPPHEARRFPVDVDFKPVSTAPGNGPDMIFEFEDFAVVVEVTLTESSRQEACEGEPVRRHVATQSYQCSKPIYGLFIAIRVDTNTAETFRVGTWYNADDVRTRLDIVPVQLKDFEKFFSRVFTNGEPRPNQLRDFFRRCLHSRDAEYAPKWKQHIGELCQSL